MAVSSVKNRTPPTHRSGRIINVKQLWPEDGSLRSPTQMIHVICFIFVPVAMTTEMLPQGCVLGGGASGDSAVHRIRRFMVRFRSENETLSSGVVLFLLLLLSLSRAPTSSRSWIDWQKRGSCVKKLD